MFRSEINYIKNERIKQNAKILVSKLPEYFYKISASSTLKYHPKYTVGEKGLYRHTKAAVRIAVELLKLEMYDTIFEDDVKDLMILALILHDGFKKGITEEKYTKVDHPLIMSNYISTVKELSLEPNEIELLRKCIETHMGQWIYDYNNNEILEKPRKKEQKFVHLCDYLASRKFLNVDFDSNDEIID